LGHGAYGFVWRTYDEYLGRWVALKLLSRGDPLTFATREAIALTALEGPHIVRVLNADRYQDVPYLATEIIDGGSAQDRLGQFGLPAELAVRWLRQMLVGLEVCHVRGLLHRDVKPSNIFLRSDEEALLGDFGVVAQVESDGTASPAGTPEIRAPESWTAGRVDVRSDIYSAGVSLYVMLTGRFPFRGNTENDIRDAVLARRHARVREVAPHVPQSIATRLERAMSADPDSRYQSAAAFHEALAEPVGSLRTWFRNTPDLGHYMCWSSDIDGPSPLSVCVSKSASSIQIETRHAAGARTRVLACCGQVTTEKQLGVYLRRLFNRL
jgi:serine/threonine-protein kinase